MCFHGVINYVSGRDYERRDATKVKEHEWPIAKAKGMERAVRVEAELVEVSDRRHGDGGRLSLVVVVFVKSGLRKRKAKKMAKQTEINIISIVKSEWFKEHKIFVFVLLLYT